MSIDGVALVRSEGQNFAATVRELGYQVRELEDGAALVNSMMNFAYFRRDREAASAWVRELCGSVSCFVIHEAF